MKRSSALADHWGLDSGVAEQLDRLAVQLSADPHAPTSVTEPVQVAEVHLADSLLGLSVPGVRAAKRIVDIGSGAGLPGLPIAAAIPDARVDLVEASARKCEWITATASKMGAANAHAVHARAEEWAEDEGRHAYDAALVRAVDSLPVLVEYGAPLLRLGGVLVAWKRNLEPSERARGERAAEMLGLEPDSADGTAAGEPPPRGETELVVYHRRTPLPAGYPRRSGRARKRPLA